MPGTVSSDDDYLIRLSKSALAPQAGFGLRGVLPRVLKPFPFRRHHFQVLQQACRAPRPWLSQDNVHVLSFFDLEDLPELGIFGDFMSNSSGVAALFGSALDFELCFDFDFASGWISGRAAQTRWAARAARLHCAPALGSLHNVTLIDIRDGPCSGSSEPPFRISFGSSRRAGSEAEADQLHRDREELIDAVHERSQATEDHEGAENV